MVTDEVTVTRRLVAVVLALGAAVLLPGTLLARAPLRPDLIVDPNDLASTWTVGWRAFDPNDCDIQEGCVLAPGLRKLLVFTVTTANIDQGELILGDETTSPFFSFSPCHGHYHLEDFSDYTLRSPANGTTVIGRKQSWCLADIERYLNEPWVPAVPVHGCGNQGLLPGWADIYDNGTECQWIDVTGLPAGDYDLTATVNGRRRIQESKYTNNDSTVRVTIPDLVGSPDLLLDPFATSASWRIVRRFVPGGDVELREGCVSGEGHRRLLEFDLRAANISTNDLHLGSRYASPAFVWDASHGHHHLPGFVESRLLDSQALTVAGPSLFETWFPLDTSPYLSDTWVRPGYFYSWENLGLQRGWSVSTDSRTICNLLDVSDVPLGPYTLNATINPGHTFAESNYTNNTVTVPVLVTEPATAVSHRPDGRRVPGAPLLFLDPGQIEGAPGPGVESVPTWIRYDINTCPASDYNLYYSRLSLGSHSYEGAICGLGASGFRSVTLPDPPPGGLLWFIVVGVRNGVEGGHGYDSQGRERPLRGLGFCGVTDTQPSQVCQ